jgi:hypothetical protein
MQVDEGGTGEDGSDKGAVEAWISSISGDWTHSVPRARWSRTPEDILAASSTTASPKSPMHTAPSANGFMAKGSRRKNTLSAWR